MSTNKPSFLMSSEGRVFGFTFNGMPFVFYAFVRDGQMVGIHIEYGKKNSDSNILAKFDVASHDWRDIFNLVEGLYVERVTTYKYALSYSNHELFTFDCFSCE